MLSESPNPNYGARQWYQDSGGELVLCTLLFWSTFKALNPNYAPRQWHEELDGEVVLCSLLFWAGL